MSERVKARATEAKREVKTPQRQKSEIPDISCSQTADSPADQILFLQRTIGNRAVERLIRSGALQAKLNIGQPGDMFEQEADRVADAVMKTPEPQVSESSVASDRRQSDIIQRKFQGCTGKPRSQHPKEDEEIKLQSKEVTGHIPGIKPGTEAHINAVRSGGQPLPENVRILYEPRFGHDFSHVRVHTDPKAAEAARAVNARAFTVGRDVVFGQGEYETGTGEGRKLLAHELAHVMQQEAAVQAIYMKRSPNVVANGYHSFYIQTMIPGSQTEVRVQFYQNPSGSGNSTFAVWYKESGTMHRVSFTFAGAIRPTILDEDMGIVTFDLNDDETPEIILTARPNDTTRGVDFSATFNNNAFFSMATAPRQQPPNNYVPGRGIYMGQLPNGRPYYMVPWSGVRPGGPMFVDDRNQLVNPALEAQGAATNEMFRTFFVGWMILSAAFFGIVGIGTTAGGAAVLRFLFTGPRAVSGGVSAAANLFTQAMEYGADVERYNWPSVGFDYVLGAVSNDVAHALFRRWPAPIFSSRALQWATWKNFGRQQIIFGLYGTLVGLMRARISNTGGGATVTAQHVEGTAQAAKSGAMQSFLTSGFGKANFPAGLRDPRVILLNKLLDFVIKVSVREIFEVTPARQGTQQGTQPSQ